MNIKSNIKTTVVTIKKDLLNKKVMIISGASILIIIALLITYFNIGILQITSSAATASKTLLKEVLSESHEVELSDSLRQSTVDQIIANESIPAYTNAQVMSMDVSKPSGVTESDLKLITQGNLVGLESAFLKAEQDYGINCLFVIAIASLESANGTQCFKPNNMFGFGSTGFSSKAEGIDVVSKALAQKYLNPSSSLYSGKTISAVNKRYAASSTWDDKVAARMTSYYSVISKSHNAAINKLK